MDANEASARAKYKHAGRRLQALARQDQEMSGHLSWLAAQKSGAARATPGGSESGELLVANRLDASGTTVSAALHAYGLDIELGQAL